MLKFFTSLTFLYAFSIVLLLFYGLMYYRSFAKNRFQKKKFPWLFLTISLACFGFLYFNINAPLSLKTFSNPDHHFIRHDGFRVTGSIELGRADTVNYKSSSFNSFVLNKKNNQLNIRSSYSEEPFYASSGESYKLLSANYAAPGHIVSIHSDSLSVNLKSTTDSSFELSVNNTFVCRTGKTIKKGIVAWNIFKDEIEFINSAWYTDENVITPLRNIMLLRDDMGKSSTGGLKYFFSSRLFRHLKTIQYDSKEIQPAQMAFDATIPDKSNITWGIGISDNNKNQFRVNYLGADSFALLNRYPVSYPLTEENRNDWTQHTVNKFLVSDSKHLLDMPPVFGEGFLFAAFNGDSTIDFSPVLLSYKKDKAGTPLNLQAKFLNKQEASITLSKNILLLPAASSGFSWMFSIRDSFDWKLGNRTFSPGIWQLMLFGVLLFFFVLVFATSWLKPANKLSWVWQLLSCVAIILLATRLFLYWRYKSFPPYEGMDLPSVQQLNSFWNFGIIILTGIILAIIFGFGFLKYLYKTARKAVASLFNRNWFLLLSEIPIPHVMLLLSGIVASKAICAG